MTKSSTKLFGMDNLWKKELDEPCGVYIDLFKDLPLKAPLNVERAAEKSNNVADKHRNAGNTLFAQKKWFEALEEYNQSLCYGENGTDSMSFAYANRSSCFRRLGQYENALRDIELAIAAKYPARLMDKLKQRKIDCLAAKASDKKVPPTKPELSYTPSTDNPEMANVLEFRQNAEDGRHVIAKCDIPVGKTVLVEKSYAAFTKQAVVNHCDNCQTPKTNLMPCTTCTIAMFCSSECMERGQAFHGKECGFIFNDAVLDRSPQFVARTIFMALDACNTVDELMQFVESVRSKAAGMPTTMNNPKDQYRAFLQLKLGLYHQNAILPAQLQADYAYRFLMAMPAIACLFDTLAKERFLMHLIVMHLIILSKNSSAGLKSDTNSIISLSLVFSMFNHQCTASVMNTGTDDKEVFITIRPIKKGEQLFNSYVIRPKPNQRQYIFNEFGFWCKCTRCVPVNVPYREKRLMENDDNYHAIQRMMTFIDLGQDVSDREKIKNLCITFLDKYGHLPYNEPVNNVTYIFKQCILFEYDY